MEQDASDGDFSSKKFAFAYRLAVHRAEAAICRRRL